MNCYKTVILKVLLFMETGFAMTAALLATPPMFIRGLAQSKSHTGKVHSKLFNLFLITK